MAGERDSLDQPAAHTATNACAIIRFARVDDGHPLTNPASGRAERQRASLP